MKMINFRGDLTDNSAKKEALVRMGPGTAGRYLLYRELGLKLTPRFSGNPMSRNVCLAKYPARVKTYTLAAEEWYVERVRMSSNRYVLTRALCTG